MFVTVSSRFYFPSWYILLKIIYNSKLKRMQEQRKSTIVQNHTKFIHRKRFEMNRNIYN